MKKEILVVDDVELNRDILEEMLENDYIISTAKDGEEALSIIEKKKTHLAAVLLDLIMPKVDGFEVLKELKAKQLLGSIPVIVISSRSDLEAEIESFEYGVVDFIQKPFDERIIKRRIQNAVELFDYKKSLEKKVNEQTNQLKLQYDILQKQAASLKKTNARIIDILGNVVESRNMENPIHIKRIKGFTKILGTALMKEYPEYELNEEKVEMIADASALHDIGKISVPDSVLLKPAKLTDSEVDIMKSHTTKGCDIIDNIEDIWEDDYRKICYDVCRSHHERYDGTGYPDGLKGENIPISAQLVSLADTYDELISERIYKDASTPSEAYQIIIKGEKGIFSPRLLEAFRKSKEAMEEYAKEVK